MTDARTDLLRHRATLLSKLAALGPAPEIAGDEQDVAVAMEAADALAGRRAQLTRELRDVDDALARVAAGTYGICETCGDAIGAKRLKALPETSTCIDCAGARERERPAQGTASRVPRLSFGSLEDE